MGGSLSRTVTGLSTLATMYGPMNSGPNLHAGSLSGEAPCPEASSNERVGGWNNGWTPLRLSGVGQLATASTLPGSIRMPSGDKINPKNGTDRTWNSHFSSLANKRFSRSHCNTSLTCWMWWRLFWEKIRMSSRYTNTNRLNVSLSTSFTSVWKTAGEFETPKGITKYSNRPVGVLKAVFYLSPFLIRTRW